VKQYLSQYSVELRAGLMNIVRRWSVMLKIEFADVYTSSSEILANPEAYGFASAETEERTPCYSSFYGDGTGTVCADPEKRAFWDSIHPTTAAHAYIAKTFEQAYNAIN
jgi:phospholipase/lecithinase/hemolysin